MREKGVSGGNSCRTSFSKKTKRVNNGKVKGTRESFVIIDLDDDNVVIIDDAPESLEKNFETSAMPRDRGKSSGEGVIHIDDDEDSGVGVGINVEVDGDLVSDASSSKSKTRFPTFRTMGSSSSRDADECEFVTRKTTAFQFSKCKQTYCTKSPEKNRYGLDPASDKYSTDSDSSDCEIVVDSFGKLREEWERASLRRKHVQNRHSGMEDQSSASESNNKAPTNFAEENNKEQHCKSGNADCMKENQPEFVASDSGYMKASFRTSFESSFMDDDKKSEEKPESVLEKESFERYEHFYPGGGSVSGHPYYRDVRQNEEDAFDGIPCRKNKEPSPPSFKAAGGTVDADRGLGNDFNNYENFCDSFWNDKEPSVQGSPFRSFEQKVVDKEATPPRTSAMEKDNLDSAQMFVTSSSGETQVNGAYCPDENLGGGTEHVLSPGVSAVRNWEGSYGNSCYQGDGQKESEGASVHNSSCDRPNFDLNESCFVLVKEQNGNTECTQDTTPPVETCIITDREKIKDTEEFKRAIEEEWASRQRVLEIQAEEARKLRKRKKAETMRLCDIERRQKQRVEEVRETQKKNAEDINLKEQLRGEIRKEINRLEITCINMASLLRGLGIPVNGGFNPMSQDVNAAYKRALLKFHPDRASRMDIRQQVEAEEKFKLISRMKEKFLTSCY